MTLKNLLKLFMSEVSVEHISFEILVYLHSHTYVHLVVYLALLKRTLVYAYMHVDWCVCIRVHILQYTCMLIYTEVMHSSLLYT